MTKYQVFFDEKKEKIEVIDGNIEYDKQIFSYKENGKDVIVPLSAIKKLVNLEEDKFRTVLPKQEGYFPAQRV